VATRSDIIDMDDYDESINMLVYGDSGIGKTVLAGTAPKALFIAIESGVIAAKRQGSKAKVWPVKTWEDVQRAYIWLRDNPNHGFEWVVIDSLTDMQEKALRWILDRAKADNSNRDEDIPAIQDHQKWQNMFKRFVDQFNDLPVNVLYTALEMKKEDEEANDVVLPLILGKDYGISQAICGKMHVVGRMSKKVLGKGDERKTVRRILFEALPPYFAKDRYDCLGRFFPNPTVPKIQAAIEGSGGVGEKPVRTTKKKKSTTKKKAARAA
jgi:phage nucleotide-binding protein